MREQLFAVGEGTDNYTEANGKQFTFANVRFPHESYIIEELVGTFGDYPLVFARDRVTKERILLGFSSLIAPEKRYQNFTPLELRNVPSASSIKKVLGLGYHNALLLHDGTLWTPINNKFQHLKGADDISMTAHEYKTVTCYSKKRNELFRVEVEESEITVLDPIPAGETVMNLYGGSYMCIVETKTQEGEQKFYVTGGDIKGQNRSVLHNPLVEMTESALVPINPSAYGSQKVTTVHIDWHLLIFVTEKELVIYQNNSRIHTPVLPTSEIPLVFTCEVVYLWYPILGELWVQGPNGMGQLGLGHNKSVDNFTKLMDTKASNTLSKWPLKAIATNYESVVLWFKDSDPNMFEQRPSLVPTTSGSSVSFGDLRFTR